MWTNNMLRSLYDQARRVELSGSEAMLWRIDEYKEKLEKQINHCSHHRTNLFRILSTKLWAVEEIRERVVLKTIDEALYEIQCFIELSDNYHGKFKRNRDAYIIAADTAQDLYEILSEEFLN